MLFKFVLYFSTLLFFKLSNNNSISFFIASLMLFNSDELINDSGVISSNLFVIFFSKAIIFKFDISFSINVIF